MAGSDYEVFDERFRNCVNRTSHVQQLWTGARWTEGPVHFPLGRYVLFSDIPNDRIMRYDETDGSVSVFRTPCGYANGHTVDRQGRLVSCEHGGRRVILEWIFVPLRIKRQVQLAGFLGSSADQHEPAFDRGVERPCAREGALAKHDRDKPGAIVSTRAGFLPDAPAVTADERVHPPFSL